MPQEAPLRLHLIYRASPGENGKPRPPFYSQPTALKSCLRSLEASPWKASITFLNDREFGPEMRALMEGRGRILIERFGSARRSYWGALRVALAPDAANCDLVWFSENDYLYTLDAFTQLHEAVQRLAQVDYFNLSGGIEGCQVLPEIVRRAAVIDVVRRVLPAPGCDSTWYEVGSTTSTYGVRPDALRADRRVHPLGPLTGGAWDNTIMMTLAGRRHFKWSAVWSGLVASDLPLTTRCVRILAKAPSRVLLNLVSYRQERRRRVLAIPLPNLATHMELAPMLAPGRDWEREGRAVCQASLAPPVAGIAASSAPPLPSKQS